MKLRTKYILFIALIHLVTLVLTFFIFRERKLLFIASEAVILVSLYFAYRLYQTLVQPLQMIMTGVDAIRDRDFSVKFQPVGQFELDELINVYNQMIDKLREERTRQQQQHYFLDKLIQTSPSGIIMLDFDGHIANCNPRASQMLGLPQNRIKGLSVNSLEGPLAEALATLPENSPQTVSINGIETFKCHKAHFIERGFPLQFITIEELTHEKLLIEKEAYGKVIRMMAHEMNNSIGPINSIFDSLRNYAPQLKSEDAEKYLEVLQIAQDRNQKLNYFMRNFADVVKLPPPKKERTDLNRVCGQVINLMRHQIGEKDIQIELLGEAQPLLIPLDVQQMEQVLINVLKNAIEAIISEGTIQVVIQSRPATLEVRNTGRGISEEEASRLFSPFYSTKPQGQGIGLTLTREILLNHGFPFSLRTEKDNWTVFRIRFA